MTTGAKWFAAGLALAAIVASASIARRVIAADPPRTISLFNIHTKETLGIVYKKDGKHIPEAMEKINWVLRDWRQNEATTMDPALIDLIWEVHNELGSQQPVHIISGYRSRTTNDKLRSTVGGQAKQSRHILGKAADVHFPDVPVRQLRYSALIRERGGVGYYPTSAIPFVHLDIDRVRHWPRMPRHELALLFPDAKTRHVPSDGRPITKADVTAAREKYKDVAVQVATFQDLRRRPRAAIQVATAPDVPIPVRAKQPRRPAPMVTAALAPAPALIGKPRPVERSSKLVPGPSEAERGKLDQLVKLAALEKPAAPSLSGGNTLADPATGAPEIVQWITAPEFDEEHPEELSYRPFPVAPLLTDSPSLDDPTLVRIEHPDLIRAIDLIDDEGTVQPMRLRPGQQDSQLAWAQQFRGEAVSFEHRDDGTLVQPPAGLARRSVTTSTH